MGSAVQHLGLLMAVGRAGGQSASGAAWGRGEGPGSAGTQAEGRGSVPNADQEVQAEVDPSYCQHGYNCSELVGRCQLQFHLAVQVEAWHWPSVDHQSSVDHPPSVDQ